MSDSGNSGKVRAERILALLAAIKELRGAGFTAAKNEYGAVVLLHPEYPGREFDFVSAAVFRRDGIFFGRNDLVKALAHWGIVSWPDVISQFVDRELGSNHPLRPLQREIYKFFSV